MASPGNVSTSHLTPPTEVPGRTLPALLQLVHSGSSFVKKLTPKSPRTAKAANSVNRQPEWYECEDLTLPSVSSF